MRKYLLPEGGQLYKANLHCHSTLSDGKYTVERIKEIYKAHGYSIIAYSDHNRLIPHKDLKDDAFLPITAVEIDTNGEGGRTYHINYFSFDEDRTEYPPFERIYGIDGINKQIALGNANGFLAQYNHPRWSFQTPADFVGLQGLWGFEIFNTGCEIDMADGWGDYEYEVMCRDGGEYPTTSATDDNHNWFEDPEDPQFDSFGGWTMVKADNLEYNTVMKALADRNCYGTTGPTIYDMYIEDGKLFVKTSPVCCACLRFETRRTETHRRHEDILTEHVFDISGDFRYFRIEFIDKFGHKAMTRAYTFDEIK